MKALDTNVVIAVINRRPLAAREWLIEVLDSRERVGISAIVVFEMIYGYEKSERRDLSEAAFNAFLALGIEPWPFERADAEHAADIRAVLERRGTPLGHYDYLIAGQARRHGAALVTANTREFERVPGLTVEALIS